jgi:hypothetical protein
MKKGPQIGGTMRDRATIRGREVISMSSECLDYRCGDCTNEDCDCRCHSMDDESEEEQDESP